MAYVDPGYGELLGVPVHVLRGYGWRHLVPPEWREDVERIHRDAIRDRRCVRLSVTLATPRGLVPIDWRLDWVRGADGAWVPVGWAMRAADAGPLVGLRMLKAELPAQAETGTTGRPAAGVQGRAAPPR